jgi:hypothetical protein
VVDFVLGRSSDRPYILFCDFVPARRFVRFTASAGFIFWRVWRDFVAVVVFAFLVPAAGGTIIW